MMPGENLCPYKFSGRARRYNLRCKQQYSDNLHSAWGSKTSMAPFCSVTAVAFPHTCTLQHRNGNVSFLLNSSKKNRWFLCSLREEEPLLLKLAVSGVTELLRIFNPEKESSNYTQGHEPPVCGIHDVLTTLQSDYDRAYFLTGNFTSAIYAEDCLFEDPTIKFYGKDLYERNLGLLVPYFDQPSLTLKNIGKGLRGETAFVQADWKLRTYLKLPWRPLISIEGTTVYDLDDKFNIIRHAESWNISALEAVGQIFKPGFKKHDE